MLDIKLIRENPTVVRENLKKRQDQDKIKVLDKLISDDKELRELTTENDKLRNKRNVVSKEIAELKKSGKDASLKLKEAAHIPDAIKKNDERIKVLEENVKKSLLIIPNLLHSSVPFGKEEKDNVEVKKVGKPPKFKFTPKNHLEILESLDLIDTNRAAKIAGNGFHYLKGDLVMLDKAIYSFALDFMSKKGYTPIFPPLMMRRKPYEGVVDISDFENVMYKIENEDLYMIATSEHPMASMFMDETLVEKELPLKFCGISPCFRKEVGAHGKYTKGLFRMHHFNKVEQFVFCTPEQSMDMHEELQKNSEELLQKLGLAFRVVNVCTGDIGSIAAKKYDNEIWMSDNQYREVGSNSNCTDYQARRLNIKYKEKDGQLPKGFVHTLNNTGIATSRVMVAILEQYQQKDGSVKIPKVLIPYMNGVKVLKSKK